MDAYVVAVGSRVGPGVGRARLAPLSVPAVLIFPRYYLRDLVILEILSLLPWSLLRNSPTTADVTFCSSSNSTNEL